LRRFPPAAKVGLKLVVGFAVVGLVATQVEWNDRLVVVRTDESGRRTTEVVVGSDLTIEGSAVLDPVFDDDGRVVSGSFEAPAEEAQISRVDGGYELVRRGDGGRPETVRGRELGWKGVARIVGEDGAKTDFALQSKRERVHLREEGDKVVRATLDAKHGLRGIAFRLLDAPGLVVGAMGLLLFAYVVGAYRWSLLLGSQGLPSSGRRCVRLTFIGFFFNNVLPGLTGGDLVKAVMIAQDHPEYRARAVGTVIVDRLVGLIVLAALSAIVLAFHAERYPEAAFAIFAFLGGALAAAVLFLSRRVRRALRFDVLARRLPGAEKLRKLDEAFFLYRSRPRAIVYACLLSVFAHVGNLGAVYLFGLGIGLDSSAGLIGPPLAAYVATVPIVMIVSSVPLLPGGWGVGELAFAYFFRTVGVWNIDLSIALSVVQRTAALLWSLVGGVYFLTHRRVVAEAMQRAAADESGDGRSET
jgi:glycosyltransferase 2 family protein